MLSVQQFNAKVLAFPVGLHMLFKPLSSQPLVVLAHTNSLHIPDLKARFACMLLDLQGFDCMNKHFAAVFAAVCTDFAVLEL